MTLGEKITKLRTEHNLSQGDLAEKINVSRQSISKWETGNSIPDLDKLIYLSELFCVTLDELVKDNAPEKASSPPQQAEVIAQLSTKIPTRKIAGWILLGIGLFSAVLGLALNLLLAFLGAYLALCGLICLFVKKHSGLVIGWGTLLPCACILPWFTSANMKMVFQPYVYQSGMVIQLVVSYSFWALLFLLICATVKNTRMKKHRFLLCGWAILSQSYGHIPVAFHAAEVEIKSYLIVAWCVLLLAIVLVFFTGRCLLQHYKSAKQNTQ